MDGPLGSIISQAAADLPFDRWKDQPVIAVRRRCTHKLFRRRWAAQAVIIQDAQSQLSVQLHRHLQEALLLAPIDGQYLVTLKLGKFPAEVIIKGVNGVLLLRRLTDQTGPFGRQFLQALTDGRVIRQRLRQNIGCAPKGILHALHAPLRVDIIPGKLFGGGTVLHLEIELDRQRLQPLFPGNRRPRAAFLLIRPVKVFHFRQDLCPINGL